MPDSRVTGKTTKVMKSVDLNPAGSKGDALVHIYPPGPNMGRKYDLHGRIANVGRDPSNHIIIDSDSVSRQHAQLTIESGRRLIMDLKSTNGTYVNNVQILSPQSLKNGDLAKIGDTIFKYLEGNDVESAYHEEIYCMTIKDGLTEIYNKRYFMEALNREMSRAGRYQRDLSLLIFDIDFFKRINDTLGHIAGDQILRDLAQFISVRVRSDDVFARYGGEEFVLILPETTHAGAMEFAEQLRQLVASKSFIFNNKELEITVSIGVATLNKDSEHPTALEFIKQADDCLYRAKAQGRNCVRG